MAGGREVSGLVGGCMGGSAGRYGVEERSCGRRGLRSKAVVWEPVCGASGGERAWMIRVVELQVCLVLACGNVVCMFMYNRCEDKGQRAAGGVHTSLGTHFWASRVAD